MTTNDDHQGGHTPFTPPPASEPEGQGAAEAQAPVDDRPADAGRSSGKTAVMIVTAVVGGFALLGTGGSAAFAATGTLLASSTEGSDSVQTEDASGLEGIDLDVDAGNMRIEFGDVEEAELAVTNSRGPAWTLERDGDELVVRSPEFRFGWWFGGWFGDDQSAVLTLPEDLRDAALDAELTLDAGSLDVVGDFGALDVTVNAGALDVEGSASSLTIDMSAGRADATLDGVDDADLTVAAGDLNVELTGRAPSQTTIDVSAGSVDLTVPDESYSIVQDVSAGSLDAKVDQSSDTRNAIDVSLSAGSVTIRPGR
ncbi:DUF4097 family beta strand repeat protein [Microbacterium sp. ISL-103]|uniref:DUF4097 family beta strand repeat-containing protein n=1 Tax=Microbacterium sp. ISL-103 TaxID=2819156 RepID=UPI001BEC3207|nr:DUF4097 family beta strand repeat-containing protein [Microbacterium sp. ISL-103]MBT2474363.1 DUF4097 family beta strand repeat protein [Microbacterium sp. ISL-103]